ncbi:MAG: threonine synthase [Pseudomonadota bacterium]
MLKNNKRTKSNVFNIEYVSTRSDNDKQEKYTFEQVVLEGLARDGGLFIPKVIPNVQERFQRWKMLSYQQLAFEIFQLFTGESIPKDDLRELVQNSYNTFSHPDITPITHTKQVSLVELYHGPTHAFKDVALQFLGNLFSYFLRKNQRQLNILGATSGDTGSAAITGVRGKTGINIFMLHPKDKISKVQEQQMTTVLDENVFNIAIDGTFDDCQNIVKALFSDLDFKDKLQLGAVNSINWARILSQVVYYFYATLRFQEANPKKPVIFSVPTGNFGDIYAGYIATKMGLPINKLIIATNENNILERTLKTGCYKVTEVQATLSPAMDIQVSSNFERFLYDLCGYDGSIVRAKMAELKAYSQYQLSETQLLKAQQFFVAYKVSQSETLATIKALAEEGIVCDPHTAVGVAAAKKYTDDRVICLSTAHPAKFPDSVHQAIGILPEKTASIAALEGLPQRCDSLPADVNVIRQYIQEKLQN